MSLFVSRDCYKLESARIETVQCYVRSTTSCPNSSLGKSAALLSSAHLTTSSGLAWHTDDTALRQKFEEFGQVEEAVSRTPPERRPCFSRALRAWSDRDASASHDANAEIGRR
jgi:hypothetical protein